MQDEDLRKVKLFGARIRKLRKSKKMSLQNLCFKNDLDPSNLSKIERAVIEPKYTTILKIAKGLGMTPGQLMDF